MEPLQRTILMSKITKKSWEENLVEPRAIVVRCSDRRFRNAHNGFIETVLGLTGDNYWPIKIAGGAGPLARPDQMTVDYGKLIHDLYKFMSPSIKHIVLITHEDCRQYDAIRSTAGKNPELQDVIVASEFIATKYSEVEVAAVYGYFTQDQPRKIGFKVLRESSLIKADEVELANQFA